MSKMREDEIRWRKLAEKAVSEIPPTTPERIAELKQHFQGQVGYVIAENNPEKSYPEAWTILELIREIEKISDALREHGGCHACGMLDGDYWIERRIGNCLR